jgi:hypothetical protein
MPVASLRFKTSDTLRSLSLRYALPTDLERIKLRAHLYPWTDTWYHDDCLLNAVVALDASQVISKVNFNLSQGLPSGKYLLVFEADQYVQPSNYFPRRFSWGLSGLEVSTCDS